MEIKTNDLICASYILSKGGQLQEVAVTEDDSYRNPYAVFILSGDDVLHLQQVFRSGKAHVELMRFQASLRHMKDVMFRALREHEMNKLQSHRFKL